MDMNQNACKKCGAALPAGATFCAACGSTVEAVAAPETQLPVTSATPAVPPIPQQPAAAPVVPQQPAATNYGATAPQQPVAPAYGTTTTPPQPAVPNYGATTPSQPAPTGYGATTPQQPFGAGAPQQPYAGAPQQPTYPGQYGAYNGAPAGYGGVPGGAGYAMPPAPKKKSPVIAIVAVVVAVAIIIGIVVGVNNRNKTAGDIGTRLSTTWFDFTVNSAEETNSYGGYRADSGNKLVVVEVTETNTTNGNLMMGNFDFMLDDPADTEYYVLAMSPQDSSMMPDEFTLSPGETVTYMLAFEVPTTSYGFSLVYIEFGVDSSGNESRGETFTVDLGF